jgi:hypothetical protein
MAAMVTHEEVAGGVADAGGRNAHAVVCAHCPSKILQPRAAVWVDDAYVLPLPSARRAPPATAATKTEGPETESLQGFWKVCVWVCVCASACALVRLCLCVLCLCTFSFVCCVCAPVSVWLSACLAGRPQVDDMFSFENVGYSHTQGTVKYLCCADCERGPIGLQRLDATPPASYVAAARVRYRITTTATA